MNKSLFTTGGNLVLRSYPQRFASRNLASGTAGSASVESALVLALIVAGLFLIFTALVLEIAADATQNATGDTVHLVMQPPISAAQTHWHPGWLVNAGSGLLVLVLSVVLLVLRRQQAKLHIDAHDEATTTPDSLEKLTAKRHQIFKVLSGDTHRLFSGQWQVRHLMTSRLTAVSEDASVGEVAELFSQGNIRHLLVCDACGDLCGVISDRDVANRSGKTAADLMSREPLTCAPNALVTAITSQMLNGRVSCIPVCEEGRVLGMVTTTDLLMALLCALQITQSMAAVTLGVEKTEMELEMTLQVLHSITENIEDNQDYALPELQPAGQSA